MSTTTDAARTLAKQSVEGTEIVTANAAMKEVRSKASSAVSSVRVILTM